LPGELFEEQRQRLGWAFRVHVAAESGGRVANVADADRPVAGMLGNVPGKQASAKRGGYETAECRGCAHGREAQRDEREPDGG